MIVLYAGVMWGGVLLVSGLCWGFWLFGLCIYSKRTLRYRKYAAFFYYVVLDF